MSLLSVLRARVIELECELKALQDVANNRKDVNASELRQIYAVREATLTRLQKVIDEY